MDTMLTTYDVRLSRAVYFIDLFIVVINDIVDGASSNSDVVPGWCQFLRHVYGNVSLVCYRYAQVTNQRVGRDKIFAGRSFPLAG